MTDVSLIRILTVGGYFKEPTHPENYDYRNSWNLIKITIITIIPKSGQGKIYNEAGKNTS